MAIRKYINKQTCVEASLRGYVNFGHELTSEDVTRIAKHCKATTEFVRARHRQMLSGKGIAKASSKAEVTKEDWTVKAFIFGETPLQKVMSEAWARKGGKQ